MQYNQNEEVLLVYVNYVKLCYYEIMGLYGPLLANMERTMDIKEITNNDYFDIHLYYTNMCSSSLLFYCFGNDVVNRNNCAFSSYLNAIKKKIIATSLHFDVKRMYHVPHPNTDGIINV